MTLWNDHRPQKQACEAERASFDVDNIVDNIVKGMVFDT
jgi:hypothetical protein